MPKKEKKNISAEVYAMYRKGYSMYDLSKMYSKSVNSIQCMITRQRNLKHKIAIEVKHSCTYK